MTDVFVWSLRIDSLPDWTDGGTQDWPNDKTKVVVTGYSLTAESDTIDLHP